MNNMRQNHKQNKSRANQNHITNVVSKSTASSREKFSMIRNANYFACTGRAKDVRCFALETCGSPANRYSADSAGYWAQARSRTFSDRDTLIYAQRNSLIPAMVITFLASRGGWTPLLAIGISTAAATGGGPPCIRACTPVPVLQGCIHWKHPDHAHTLGQKNK